MCHKGDILERFVVADCALHNVNTANAFTGQHINGGFLPETNQQHKKEQLWKCRFW